VVADGSPNNYAAFFPGGWMTSLLAEKDHALGCSDREAPLSRVA